MRRRTDNHAAREVRRNPGGRARRSRPAFALIDLLLTVALIGILAAIVVPSIQPDESLKLISATVMISSDVEYAQSATLSSPIDPTTFRVDPATDRYWLALASTPATPILRSDGSTYEVKFGQGNAEFLAGFGLSTINCVGDAIAFDQFGRLGQGADAYIVVQGLNGSESVRISATTGSVFIGE